MSTEDYSKYTDEQLKTKMIEIRQELRERERERVILSI